MLRTLLPLALLLALATPVHADNAGALTVVPLITEAMQNHATPSATSGGLFVVPLITEAMQSRSFADIAESPTFVVPLITEAMQSREAPSAAGASLFVVPLVTESMHAFAAPSPVPEPSTWLFMLAGGAALAGARLRRGMR